MARPTDEYQLRKSGLDGVGYQFKFAHLFYVVDLFLLFGLFTWGGQSYFETKGRPEIALTQQERTAVVEEAKRLAVQADSVVAASRLMLEQARQDSVAAALELDRKRAAIEVGYQEIQEEQAKTVAIGSGLYELRQSAETNVIAAENYDAELKARESEIVRTDSAAVAAEKKLQMAKLELGKTSEELQVAHSTVAYEPHSRFPTRSGVMLRNEMRSDANVTGVEVQHVMWERNGTDVGLSLGFGLGSGDVESTKNLGVLFTRPLVHRKWGLDVGAGYSVLTSETGNDDSTPYVSGGLRYSPFYKERFHVGLGARADEDGVQPFIGLALGRR